MRLHGVIETCLYVDDLVAAEDFVTRVLGLKPLAREPGRHVFFPVGEASMLLLFDPASTAHGEHFPHHGAHGPGHAALGIAAEDYEPWKARLVAAGVAIEKEIVWPLGGRSVYFRDPAGNSFELITPHVWGLPAGW